MTPQRLLTTAILPAAAELFPFGVGSPREVQVFMIAIALQESGLEHRRQVSSGGEENGPASGFWQFEKGGACAGILQHKTSAPHIRRVCQDFNIEPNSPALWEAIRYQDIVATIAARLLVLTIPYPLPLNAAQGWEQYNNTWRPGRPRPATWAKNWAIADATLRSK